MDINEQERLSTFTLRHKLKNRYSPVVAILHLTHASVLKHIILGNEVSIITLEDFLFINNICIL